MDKTILFLLAITFTSAALASTTVTIKPGTSVDIQAGDSAEVYCEPGGGYLEKLCYCDRYHDLTLMLPSGKEVVLRDYNDEGSCTNALVTRPDCKK